MRWQIYGVWASFIIALVGLSLIVWTVEPQTTSPLVKSLFFVVLFILTWSAVALIIFLVTNRLVKARALSKAAYEPIFYDSFLKGLLISILFTAILLIKKFI